MLRVQIPVQPVRFRPRAQRAVVLLLPLVLAFGCRREEIQVYRVEKDSSAKATVADPHAGHDPAANPHGGMGGAVVLPKLGWKLPAGWTEQPPSSMRVASFAINGSEGQTADVAVIPLPGVTGRDLDMVNMWRSQVRLEAIDAAGLERLVTKTPIGGAEGKLFDMVGETILEGAKSPLRVLVALLDREGSAWFFKMTGPDPLVGAQKPAFVDFLKSVEFRASGATETAASVPSGATPMNSDGSAASGGGKPDWAVPEGWREAPAGQFLFAKFVIAGEGSAQAVVNISMSAGEGGGLVGNVNRWRAQLGLSEQSPDEIRKAVTAVETPGGKAMFVEMAGTDAKSGQTARLIGAVVPQNDRTWFYKLMGDGKIVEAQKAAFTRFVQSVKY